METVMNNEAVTVLNPESGDVDMLC